MLKKNRSGKKKWKKETKQVWEFRVIGSISVLVHFKNVCLEKVDARNEGHELKSREIYIKRWNDESRMLARRCPTCSFSFVFSLLKIQQHTYRNEGWCPYIYEDTCTVYCRGGVGGYCSLGTLVLYFFLPIFPRANPFLLFPSLPFFVVRCIASKGP